MGENFILNHIYDTKTRNSIAILKTISSIHPHHSNAHANLQVAETCQLAVRRLEWLQSEGEKQLDDASTDKNPYCSIDPAPPAVKRSVSELRVILLDESLPLFERYRAMFALRNVGSEEAALALADGRIQHSNFLLFQCITAVVTKLHNCNRSVVIFIV